MISVLSASSDGSFGECSQPSVPVASVPDVEICLLHSSLDNVHFTSVAY